ncbi:helix-turn-helix domain-containing protein [Geminicoccus harenae]|uniref:helix-turn-helix domain-containing protein n=1 Tax=Geminicoccus harenae TaxID=2498453 RepID=UPI00168B4C2F|nr:helix-turn-helix transcriptional regulator [Geminicoccus harenae]
MTIEHPDPVDVHVGKRLKLRRTLVGMSQERLGELLGVTFQQIQKYERGANRMGSSRLFAISRILDTPVAWFFDEMDEAPQHGLAEDRGGRFDFSGAPRTAPTPSLKVSGAAVENRETLELVRAFHRIDDPTIRRRLAELAKALAGLSPARPPADRAYSPGNAADWSLSRSHRSS